MKYGWLIPLVIIVIVAALVAGWFLSREAARRSGKKGWVANTGYVRELPKYQALVRRSRLMLAGASLSFALLVGAVSISAGSPVDRRIEDERLASRDIVLCLDASGSMMPYDGQIGSSFRQIIEHFSGERISLHLWSARTIIKFPLTDDYVMADEILEEMSTIISEGYMGEAPDGSSVYVTTELLDYLEGVDDPDRQASSLAGDGLASCILSFDHTDQERSRTVLLATDNEIMGSQIYTLTQATDLAKDQNVTVTALYPGEGDYLTADGEELRDLVESTGGTFYDASDPGSVAGIIQDIEAQQQVELEGQSHVIETDKPETPLAWIVVGLLALLTVLAGARL
ncbi:VWA domain-containing protein [Schaalia vaccimaxillae]|uniref:VWA domain-containing protein n=1 Tax=Schaalia vaccimaxillae TaxID=183916 RepID=UPI0003B30C17|nr:VWA domain-containing protein [Schaalia vaccimaxillae]